MTSPKQLTPGESAMDTHAIGNSALDQFPVKVIDGEECWEVPTRTPRVLNLPNVDGYDDGPCRFCPHREACRAKTLMSESEKYKLPCSDNTVFIGKTRLVMARLKS